MRMKTTMGEVKEDSKSPRPSLWWPIMKELDWVTEVTHTLLMGKWECLALSAPCWPNGALRPNQHIRRRVRMCARLSASFFREMWAPSMGPCPVEGTEDTRWGQIQTAHQGKLHVAVRTRHQLIPGLARVLTTWAYFPEIGFSPFDLPKKTLLTLLPSIKIHWWPKRTASLSH